MFFYSRVYHAFIKKSALHKRDNLFVTYKNPSLRLSLNSQWPLTNHQRVGAFNILAFKGPSQFSTPENSIKIYALQCKCFTYPQVLSHSEKYFIYCRFNEFVNFLVLKTFMHS